MKYLADQWQNRLIQLQQEILILHVYQWKVKLSLLLRFIFLFQFCMIIKPKVFYAKSSSLVESLLYVRKYI